ncbi:MAG: insulinase family protein, partial [Bacteroidales bacterium]|nr:insulinase family protein [Bacteroidales bacterium]
KMEPKEVPEFTYEEEKPLEENIIDTVVGINPAMLAMVYPLPSPRNEEMAIAELVATVLTNDKTGLMDVNLNQAQKVMFAGAYYMSLADYGVMELVGMPRQGQTLEEVRDLLLEQIEKLKNGEFDEAMLKATLANFEVEQYQNLRNNNNRAMMMMEAFNQHDDWANVVSRLERLSKVTKQQVVDFANKYLNHYAIIYKLEGAPNLERIEKPQITPLSINRDTTSAYLTDVRNTRPADLTPRFVDFNKDLTVSKFENKLELLYKKNDADPLFSLYYVYEMGSFNDRELDLAFQYIPYLGTDKYTAEELQNELYKLAADYRTVASNERVYVYLTGIDKNFEASVELFEHILSSVKADPERYANLAMDYIKGLDDSKKQQNANLKHLINYTVYGPVNPATYELSAQEVMEMNPETLTEKFKNLRNYEHTIMYFGPRSLSAMNKVLVAHHILPETFLPIPEAYNFTYRENEGKVFFAPYEAPQVNVVNLMVSVPYEKEIEVAADMYNSYFGGGMSGIVFQEIREARPLAYSAYAYMG